MEVYLKKTKQNKMPYSMAEREAEENLLREGKQEVTHICPPILYSAHVLLCRKAFSFHSFFMPSFLLSEFLFLLLIKLS